MASLYKAMWVQIPALPKINRNYHQPGYDPSIGEAEFLASLDYSVERKEEKEGLREGSEEAVGPGSGQQVHL